jgi:hypothetical protein
MIVYTTQNYWVCGPTPSSGIPDDGQNPQDQLFCNVLQLCMYVMGIAVLCDDKELLSS